MGKVADALSERTKIDYEVIVGSEIRAALQELKDEAAHLQLVAGRYQFMWEKAQRCINEIDDMFEYRYKLYDHDGMQKGVRTHLRYYTEAVASLKNKK